MDKILSDRRRKKQLLFVAVLIGCLLAYFSLPFNEISRRIAAIFIFAIFFWAFEIIPLYATSLAIVLLLTLFLALPGGVLKLGKTGYQLFLIPFSNPVIILFLGGFVLASAANKYRVDAFLMKKMISKFGKGPKSILIGFLLISAFFSMWMSNTVTTAIMLSVIHPLVSKLDLKDPLRKSLVLSTAFGAALGGIATPIGTPPNAIATGILEQKGIDFDFVSWVAIGIPFAIMSCLICVLVLLFFFPPMAKKIELDMSEVKLEKNGFLVLMIALGMIILWLTEPFHKIPEAIVSLGGITVFAGFQFISQEDFRNLNWDILVLMWGGLALGDALLVGGVIDEIMGLPLFSWENMALFSLFGFIALFLSTFISNTAAANLLIPIAVNFANIPKTPIAFSIAISCSLALALPISTPPNAMVYATKEIEVKDMFKAGATISILCFLLLLFSAYFLLPLFSAS